MKKLYVCFSPYNAPSYPYESESSEYRPDFVFFETYKTPNLNINLLLNPRGKLRQHKICCTRKGSQKEVKRTKTKR